MKMSHITRIVEGLSPGCALQVGYTTVGVYHVVRIEFIGDNLYSMAYETDLSNFPTLLSSTKADLLNELNQIENSHIHYLKLFDSTSSPVTSWKSRNVLVEKEWCK